MTISDEWWDRWWEEDYSWEGLAQKSWYGWYVDTAWAEGEAFEPVPEDERVEGVVYREATLQDYWRRAGCADDLYASPDGDKHFTLMHLPPRWQDGTATIKADPENPPEALVALLKIELGREVRETVFESWGVLKGPDHRMQWDGSVLPDFRFSNLSPQARSEVGKSPISLTARDAAFSGNANFDIAAFSGDANFENAAFSGNANFYSAAFSGTADFESAAFSGNANFYSAAFSGTANFENAAFSGNANFYSAAFSGNANFYSAAFSGTANFDIAAFSSSADFSSAAFSGDANFENAAFSGNANFYSAAFSGDANFENAAFSGNAYFISAAFSGTAYFQSAAFSGNANFNSAAFSGTAYFQSAVFSGNADFNSAAFSGTAYFNSAAFSGTADFESAIFVGVAIFSGQGNSVKSDAVSARLMPDPVQKGVQKFEQPEAIMWTARRSFPFANFREAIFLEPALFDNRDFHSKADFDETSFFKHAAFHGSDLHRGVVFRDTHFSASLNPEKGFAGSQSLWAKLRKRKNVQLLPESALRRLHEVFVRRCEVADEVAPAFNDWAQAFEAMRRWKAAIFAGVAKDGAKAKLDRLKYFGASEDSFRTLKQIMEDRRDRMEEARFFKLELLARRQRRGGWWAKLPSRIYGGLSDFGSSMVRPFLWLVVSVLLFAFLYAAMGAFFAGGFGSHDYGEALNYSLSRVFPFGDWTEVRDCSLIGQMQADGGNYELCLGEGETAYKYREGTALTVRFVGMVQSLFALILVFLLGLAARRRFQIN